MNKHRYAMVKKYNFIKMARNNKCKLKSGKIKVLAKQDNTPVYIIEDQFGSMPVYQTPWQCFLRENAIAIKALLLQRIVKRNIERNV